MGELIARRFAVEALVDRAAAAVDARAPDARDVATAAKLVASDAAVWAVDRAARLAASRSYAAGDELARLRRDAPQTQIGEGANDALLHRAGAAGDRRGLSASQRRTRRGGSALPNTSTLPKRTEPSFLVRHALRAAPDAALAACPTWM